jgi:hypothetical protein
MTALIIDQQVRDNVKRAVEYAEANPITADRILELARKYANGEDEAVGDDPNRVVEIPFGFRCVFSIEEQPAIGRYQHLSVSMNKPAPACPNLPTIVEIMKLFGFTQSIGECVVNTEEMPCGGINRVVIDIIGHKAGG